MATNKAVFGIYPTWESLEEGMEVLRKSGFRNTDISVLYPHNPGTKEFATSKSTKAPEGVTAGAGSGAFVGGTLGWLAGIGSLAIPGIGPFIAAGPIMGLLAGIGAGGAVGGVLGGFIGLGIPEYEAKRYAGRLHKGGILASVHSDDSSWAKKAKRILEETGAEDISTTSEEHADFATSDKPQPRRSSTTGAETKSNVMVREVMRPGAASVGIDATLREASIEMRDENVGLLTVRSGDDIVGVVTERDLLARATSAGYDPSQVGVRVALTQDYPYCFEYQDTTDAERTMDEREVKHMLVLNENRHVVGVISKGDLTRKQAAV
jgi:CBS domain-containing protein